jgi:hypothetical protein
VQGTQFGDKEVPARVPHLEPPAEVLSRPLPNHHQHLHAGRKRSGVVCPITFPQLLSLLPPCCSILSLIKTQNGPVWKSPPAQVQAARPPDSKVLLPPPLSASRPHTTCIIVEHNEVMRNFTQTSGSQPRCRRQRKQSPPVWPSDTKHLCNVALRSLPHVCSARCYWTATLA